MALAANMIEGVTPHPVPLACELATQGVAGMRRGEGTVLHALSVIQASLLQPYPGRAT